jgi:hypothetical protein
MAARAEVKTRAPRWKAAKHSGWGGVDLLLRCPREALAVAGRREYEAPTRDMCSPRLTTQKKDANHSPCTTYTYHIPYIYAACG